MNFTNLLAYNVSTVDDRASSGISKFHKPRSIHDHNPDICNRNGRFLQPYTACYLGLREMKYLIHNATGFYSHSNYNS